MTRSELAAVILCGGKSSRMGQPKHLLPIGDQTVLERVVTTLREVTSEIIIVAAAGQDLPTLSEDVRVIRDEQEYQGPLAGLLMGLRSVSDVAELVYLTGCDTPLLSSAFVDEVVRALGQAEIAVPYDEQFAHPLAAVYRTSIVDKVRDLYESGERRPRKLLEICETVRIPTSQLRKADSELRSLRNMNTPEDYQQLLTLAGSRSTC